jgi:hypothetical protein
VDSHRRHREGDRETLTKRARSAAPVFASDA